MLHFFNSKKDISFYTAGIPVLRTLFSCFYKISMTNFSARASSLRTVPVFPLELVEPRKSRPACDSFWPSRIHAFSFFIRASKFWPSLIVLKFCTI